MKYKFFSTAAVFILVWTLLNLPTTAYAEGDQEKAYHDLTITALVNRGGFLANGDVDIYLDSNKICSIKCGDVFSDAFSLKEGTHTVRFAVKGSHNYYSRALIIKADCNLNCILKEGRDGLQAESFDFTMGCDRDILSLGTPEKIDAYNFSIVFQMDKVTAKRGSFTKYCYLDPLNEIMVEVTDYSSTRYEPRAKAEKVMIDSDGGVHRAFYFEGELHILDSSFVTVGANYYVRRDSKGTVEETYPIEYVAEPVPSLLEKTGFFEEYPTPSDFLSSDTLYPVLGAS